MMAISASFYTEESVELNCKLGVIFLLKIWPSAVFPLRF